MEKARRKYNEQRGGGDKKRKKEKEMAPAEIADYESAAVIFSVKNTKRDDEGSEEKPFGPK